MKNLLVDTPNLSVMLPGGCNAKCDFCFWDRNSAGNHFSSSEYASRLIDHVESLPNCFRQISITGGEPTISPALDGVLAAVSRLKERGRIDKVVITTNGVGLLKRLLDIVDCVDHINISRHHYDDWKNAEIFKTRSIPETSNLFGIVSSVHANSDIDVCFNCVVPPSISSSFCYAFIDYAKQIGVKAVSFRIYHNEMDECRAQKFFESQYETVDVSTCPVCRTVRMVVEGLCVNWKYSVLEPTQHWDGVYELIMQPNGKLTADWAGKIEINPRELEEVVSKKKMTDRELEEEKIRLARELIEMSKKLLESTSTIVVHETRVVHDSGHSGGGCSGHSYGGGCS